MSSRWSCFGGLVWLWLELVAPEIAVALLPKRDELWILVPWGDAPEFLGVLATSTQLTDLGVVERVVREGWLRRRMGA